MQKAEQGLAEKQPFRCSALFPGSVPVDPHTGAAWAPPPAPVHFRDGRAPPSAPWGLQGPEIRRSRRRLTERLVSMPAVSSAMQTALQRQRADPRHSMHMLMLPEE